MFSKFLSLLIVLFSTNIASATQVVRNIPYTLDGNQLLDLFLPEEKLIVGTEPRPTAIVMHGGGWSIKTQTRDQIEFIAVWLASQGFVVINVDYSLAPESK